MICIICLSLLLASFSAGAAAEELPSVSAGAVVVMHSGGEVVYEKNADMPVLIASTTKIMTAILAIENCSLEELVKIDAQVCGIEGSSMYLKPGEEYSVKELLLGLMLVSGNDAAAALAVHVSGCQEEFVAAMNEKARELGMKESSFKNPHGLNAEGHFSTASDMAKLMLYCMENPIFAEIASTGNCTVGESLLINHNKLLRKCEGCIGGKTGYTEAAGRCLVSCCERDGTRFVIASFSAPDDWNDHMKLYDWAFGRYSVRCVTEGISFELPVISGISDSIRLVPEEIKLFLEKDAELTLKAEMPHFVFAPLTAGDTAGEFIVYKQGEELARGKLVYENSLEEVS